MKINFKKTLVVTLIAAIAVNATVITSMESDKRKQILATDVESQAGPIDPIGDITRLASVVTETINAIRGTTGPLGEINEYQCERVQFSSYLNNNGITQQNLDAYLNAQGKENENNKAGGTYNLNSNNNVVITAEIKNQYFPMEPHVTAYCKNVNGLTCKNIDKQSCIDQFKSYMKAIKKYE